MWSSRQRLLHHRYLNHSEPDWHWRPLRHGWRSWAIYSPGQVKVNDNWMDPHSSIIRKCVLTSVIVLVFHRLAQPMCLPVLTERVYRSGLLANWRSESKDIQSQRSTYAWDPELSIRRIPQPFLQRPIRRGVARSDGVGKGQRNQDDSARSAEMIKLISECLKCLEVLGCCL
jgi:hypothetical protein